jgi:hypothetical protein
MSVGDIIFILAAKYRCVYVCRIHGRYSGRLIFDCIEEGMAILVWNLFE